MVPWERFIRTTFSTPCPSVTPFFPLSFPSSFETGSTFALWRHALFLFFETLGVLDALQKVKSF